MIRHLPLPALRLLDRVLTRATDLVLRAAVTVEITIELRTRMRADAARDARIWTALERRIAADHAARAAGVAYNAKGGDA